MRALPFWLAHGQDPLGLAHEELDFHGRPRELGYRRTMVQFRQAYVFAWAALQGLCDPKRAAELFLRTAQLSWHPDGGFVHRLTPTGSVLDRERHLYDQAFGLFAAAAVERVVPGCGALGWAYRTLSFCDTCLGTPEGYIDTTARRLGRSQNPHMHLYEGLLSLYEVHADPSLLARAEALRALAARRMISPHGGLMEQFGEDWSPQARANEAVVEPGHLYEWVFLLRWHDRLSAGSPAGDNLARRLYAFATAHGTRADGLPRAALTSWGEPVAEAAKLWAVCEAIKAHIAEAEAQRSPYSAGLSRLVPALFERFLPHAAAPLWFEGLLADGKPEARRMPASTLYHLTFAIGELLRFGEGTSHTRLR